MFGKSKVADAAPKKTEADWTREREEARATLERLAREAEPEAMEKHQDRHATRSL